MLTATKRNDNCFISCFEVWSKLQSWDRKQMNRGEYLTCVRLQKHTTFIYHRYIPSEVEQNCDLNQLKNSISACIWKTDRKSYLLLKSLYWVVFLRPERDFASMLHFIKQSCALGWVCEQASGDNTVDSLKFLAESSTDNESLTDYLVLVWSCEWIEFNSLRIYFVLSCYESSFMWFWTISWLETVELWVCKPFTWRQF